MKFEKARIGEKLVFPDNGGIWKKVDDHEAISVWPRKGCCSIKSTPEQDVYVIFEDRKPLRTPVGSTPGAMRLVVQEADDKPPILEMPEATPQQIAAYSAMSEMKLTPKGKRKPRLYMVEDCGVDADTQTLVVEISPVGGQ